MMAELLIVVVISAWHDEKGNIISLDRDIELLSVHYTETYQFCVEYLTFKHSWCFVHSRPIYNNMAYFDQIWLIKKYKNRKNKKVSLYHFGGNYCESDVIHEK